MYILDGLIVAIAPRVGYATPGRCEHPPQQSLLSPLEWGMRHLIDPAMCYYSLSALGVGSKSCDMMLKLVSAITIAATRY